MSYREYKGNLFASGAQTLVNTVNCVGVMGKGIALEFRRRHPQMFEEYCRACQARSLHPGDILPFRKGHPWILNFAVKNDWKHPSRLEWVESCLRKFVENYRRLGITSVAMPWLGAMNGRLPWDQVHHLIRSYLHDLNDVDISLVEFDSAASDPLFDALTTFAQQVTTLEFSERTGIAEHLIRDVLVAVRNRHVRSMTEVSDLPGLGKKSIDNLYLFLMRSTANGRAKQPGQGTFF